ncbi:hypothetical protein Lepto7376_2628 [[Leptolyngbya] sp. PCC 7376]|uniref:hypothetical protein n=1 Tax=[Leptolyngbya] sp. PCC 7376 TaxID=111781 RepID=UPI00029EDA21|nr:hypothetical protein [[Leptolyngbya] sp. PCC 7376]AFY38899.1 hypothetical protein Lepto7376_2628 [[Leptolyngbya] sp. PCC 7376]
MAQTLSKANLRFNSEKTVEHPFDTKFIPAQPDSDWVKLTNIESDEYALLLCPYSEVEWLVWLPSRGEAVLHNDHLCHAA